MAFDALGVLKGEYSGALVDVDESDVAPTSLTVNDDGNSVIDLHGTGADGLAAVLVMTEEADSDAYSDETTVEIEASDELDRGWEGIAQFQSKNGDGVFRSHLILLKDCVATTGFVASDATSSLVLTATTGTDTGRIVAFDEALKTVGGIGDILVEAQDSGDAYGTEGDTLTATSGTGIATQGVAGVTVLPGIQHQPGIYTCRFATPKRYIRAKVTAADNIGKCWILLTDHAFKTI